MGLTLSRWIFRAAVFVLAPSLIGISFAGCAHNAVPGLPAPGSESRSLGSTAFIASGSWSSLAPMPSSLVGGGVGVVGSTVYIVGGFNAFGCGTQQSTLFAYDTISNTWTTKAAKPTAADQLAVSVVNGILYAIGGQVECGPTLTTTTVEAYDPATNTWTSKAPLPVPQAEHGAAVVNGIIYVVGGTDITAVPRATLWAYDPGANSWTLKAPMPTARWGLNAVALNGLVYALGGYNSISGTTTIATVEAYDPSTNSWTSKAPMTITRARFAAASVNGAIYVSGGDGRPGSTWLASAEGYDPLTNAWTAIPDMPTARNNLPWGDSHVNGVFYAIGGNSSGGTFETKNEAFTVATPTPCPPFPCVIHEYPIGRSPWRFALGGDGNLYWNDNSPPDGPSCCMIGRINTAGQFTFFPVTDPPNPATGPSRPGHGPDGHIWFGGGGPGNGFIARIRRTGAITVFHTPSTSTAAAPSAGSDGRVWFTEPDSNMIGAIDTGAPNTITEYPVLTPNAGLHVTAKGPDGNVWFVEDNVSKIGRITPSGVVTEYNVPGLAPADGVPQMVRRPGGNVWFVENDAGGFPKIAKITPQGVITQIAILPAGCSRYGTGIAWALDGNLYFTCPRSNQIGRLIPSSGVITLYPVPTPNSRPVGIALGADGNIWFGEAKANQIGVFQYR